MARHKRSYTGERRTEHIGFYATPTERAELEAAAAQRGANRSEYTRELVYRRLGTPVTVAGVQRNADAAALVNQVRPLGVNMNQVARHLNATGEIRDYPELRELLAGIKAVLARPLAL
jgi:hypothetical protein